MFLSNLRLGFVLIIASLSTSGNVIFAQSAQLPGAWELGPTGSQANLRGLSIAADKSLWACGSDATVLRSIDGGSSWISCGPSGFGSLEFRSLHAFDSQAACIASAGTPAVILRTEDGGSTWTEVYREPAATAFFNALRFWDDRRGIAVGDPIDGRILIAESFDGGRHWQRVSSSLLPESLAGEASFAASNSCLEIAPNGQAWIGTGGAKRNYSRIYRRETWSAGWKVSDCPLPSGATLGVFSLAFDDDHLVAVGGDYREEVASQRTAAFSIDAGLNWQLSEAPPDGFRSSVVKLPDLAGDVWLASGPGGTDWSRDGDAWKAFSPIGFHALSAGGSHVFAVGSQGRFGKLQLMPAESESTR